MDRRLRRWITTLVVIVATSVALLLRRSPDRRLHDAWRTLRTRPIEGRLTGFEYIPRQILRGGDDGADLATRRLIGVAQLAAAGCDSTNDTSACATAALLAGTSEKAIGQLVRRVTRDGGDAATWSDLACAYLQRGVATADGSAYARALAASDEALDRESGFAPALFNRALALDLLELGEPAAIAYARFLAIEPGSGWSEEAHRRVTALSEPRNRELWQHALPRLRQAAERDDAGEAQAIVAAFPQESRAWGETEFLGDWAASSEKGDDAAGGKALQLASMTASALHARNGDAMLRDCVMAIRRARNSETLRLLVRGHQAYRDARRAYSQRKVAEAISRFEEVSRMLHAAGSPLAGTADYFRANALLDVNRADEAIAECDRLQRETPAQYRALHAQLFWLQATARGGKGLLYDALSGYERALEEFTALGEVDNAQFMRAGVAWCNDFLGREREAWRAQLDLCRVLSRSGDARTLQVALNAAGDSQVRREEWSVARSIYRVSVEIAPAAQNPRATARARVWLALAATRIGAPTAPSDMLSARAAANALPDETMRHDAINDLTTAEAISIYRERPADAVHILDGPIAHARNEALDFQLGPLYVTRARANVLLGKTTDAIRDYEQALATIERRRDSVGGIDARDTYFGINENIYREEIDLLDRGGLYDRAFVLAERQRRWSDHRSAGLPLESLPVAELAAKLPPGAVVTHYVALNDRLVAYVPGPRGVERFTTNLPRTRLAELTNELLTAASDDDPAKAQAAGSALYSALIAPIHTQLRGRDLLAVAGDALIARIPFAALYEAGSKHHLIDDLTVVYSRSAAAFVENTPVAQREQHVVIAGDPAFDPSRFRNLRRLDAAAEEARLVGRLYPGAQVLTGEEATRDHLIPQLLQATIAHIATHAVSNDRDAALSSLILASAGSDAATLSMRELTSMNLSQLRVVMLAGCRTSLPSGGYGDLRSLASAVHAAGARNVIGALWDLEDEASRDVSVAFHEELRRGASPAAALRYAQMLQKHANPGRLSRWAGLQLYGNGRN